MEHVKMQAKLEKKKKKEEKKKFKQPFPVKSNGEAEKNGIDKKPEVCNLSKNISVIIFLHAKA